MKRLLFLVVGLIACSTTFADHVIYYAKRDSVRVLQTYDASAAILGYLSKGTPIKVIGSTFAYKGLFEVEIKRVKGYVLIRDLSEEYIEQTNKEEIVISSKPTYYALRETRLLQSYERVSATVAKIQSNETMQIIGSTFAYKGLYEAVYKGKRGYVLANDVAYLDKRTSERPKSVQKPPQQPETRPVIESQKAEEGLVVANEVSEQIEDESTVKEEPAQPVSRTKEAVSSPKKSTSQPESKPVVNEQVIEEEPIASEGVDQTESTNPMPVVTEENQLSEKEIVQSQTETMPWFNLDAKDMRYLTIIVIILVVLLHYIRKVKKDNDLDY